MLSRAEIETIGFASVGEDVRISEHARFYGASRIRLGNHVRIDDFCVLSAGEGGIEIGDYVHIAVYCSLIGQGKIVMADFSGLSSRVSIYSSNDDYSGAALTNPTVPKEFTNVYHAPVHLGRHVIVGSGSIILPGVTLEEGVAVGALSLVNKDCAAFGIYFGNPAKRIKERRRDLLELEARLLAGLPHNALPESP
ncbi:MAG: acyltransferase [Rhodocyclaceae bacterium]|nr:acyltransferase [Rhodocyclaceae bacterium]